ncbi:hypothetical protein GCM10009642_41800 [Nocardiopsis metallicus]
MKCRPLAVVGDFTDAGREPPGPTGPLPDRSDLGTTLGERIPTRPGAGHVMSMLTNNRKQRWLLPVVLGSIMLIVVLGAVFG